MKRETPVACGLTVFTGEQREAYKKIWGELETRRTGIAELEHGYEHQFPGDAETLRLIHEWVSMERVCCPFLTFSVIARNIEEPILLQLTGNEDVKAFLKTDLQLNIDLITGQS